MALDVTYGNLPQEQADRMEAAVAYPDEEALYGIYEQGATEPWIAELICALLKATGTEKPTVLETGGYMGTTSAWLADAIDVMGGGKLIVAEMDPERATIIHNRLSTWGLGATEIQVLQQDAMQAIHAQPDRSLALAFVDDDHLTEHVRREVDALLPKLRPGGLILFHDVYGVCNLHNVVRQYGGYSLDFPRCGPAGGLGILQC